MDALAAPLPGLAAADPLTDPKAQDRLVDEAIANQKAFWSIEERRLAELRKILTPAQTTRLLIVLPRASARSRTSSAGRSCESPRRRKVSMTMTSMTTISTTTTTPYSRPGGAAA